MPTRFHRLAQGLRTHWREALLLLLLVWLLVPLALRGSINAESPLTGIDFGVYYGAGQRLNAGQPLYVEPSTYGMGTFNYLPPVALAFRPLSSLPQTEALKIWNFINILALLGAVAMFARAMGMGWKNSVAVGIMLLLGFRYWPTTYNLALGQINLLALFLIASLYLAQSRQQWIWFGVIIALAALIKTWMLGFVVYLIINRQWRALAVSLGVTVVAAALSLLLIGAQEMSEFFRISALYSSQPWLVSQSLIGFARLHLAENSLMQPLVQSRAAYISFILAGYAMLGVGLCRLYKVANSDALASPYQKSLQLGFFILTFLLALPLCHMEYFVYFLPLFWTVLASVEGYETQGATARSFRRILFFFAIYVLFTRPWPISGPALGAYNEGLKSLIPSLYFFGAISLWIATFVLLKRSPAALRPASRA